MQKCKKCNRAFQKKRANQKYCCPDCKVNDHRGTKSKWEKVLLVLNDDAILKTLGVVIQKNSSGYDDAFIAENRKQRGITSCQCLMQHK